MSFGLSLCERRGNAQTVARSASTNVRHRVVYPLDTPLTRRKVTIKQQGSPDISRKGS
jgi:hypothetical protein